MKRLSTWLICTIALVNCLVNGPAFTVDAHHPVGKVSPLLHGLMSGEINHKPGFTCKMPPHSMVVLQLMACSL